jgi:hypothetical protein
MELVYKHLHARAYKPRKGPRKIFHSDAAAVFVLLSVVSGTDSNRTSQSCLFHVHRLSLQIALRGGGVDRRDDGEHGRVGAISVAELAHALSLAKGSQAPSGGEIGEGARRRSEEEDGHVQKQKQFISEEEVARALNCCDKARELATLSTLVDPADTDLGTQINLEAAIKKRNIEHNLELAIEHCPELYSSICMLRLRCHVNNVEVDALVDTGAQATIMSWHCAERCGVLRLVDERFDGVARGVGSRRIAGRIHLLPLKIEHLYLSMSVLVLAPEDKLVKTSHIQESPAVADEGRPAALRTRNVDERSTSSADMDVQIDFLLGLDSLRRYQCCVDLARNVLVIPLSTAEAGGGGERGGGAADSTEIVGKSGDPRVRWSSSGVRGPPTECDPPPALLLVPFLN